MILPFSSSNELVGSSKKIIFGSVYKALAIAILCICPPDKLFPLSPTKNSARSFLLLIRSSRFVFFYNLIHFVNIYIFSVNTKGYIFYNR